MKIAIRYLAVIVLSLTVMACTASAQSQFTMTIGGNPVVARSQVDASSFYLMDTNHPFTSDGLLTSWEIFAQNTNPVALVIYRQTGGAFVEVGRSNMMTPVVGYNQFSMGRKFIHVHAGDFVGAYQPPPGGSIAYSVDDGLRGGGFECQFPGVENAVAVTFQGTTSSTSFTGSCNRHYSLRAIGWQEAFQFPMPPH